MRWLTAWDTGSPQPAASTLNDYAGLITSNSAVVPAGTGGSINIFTKDATQVVIDINGYYAASSDMYGNTAFGTGALLGVVHGDSSPIFGTDNTAVGTVALANNTTGYYNTASGASALHSNTTGGVNTASGTFALGNNTAGAGNTATGAFALDNNTTGGVNTASGLNALANNTTGSHNTATGANALYGNTAGGVNTASGFNALFNNTTGNDNTASGSSALQHNTTGNYNTASGEEALASNTTGSLNTASGFNALFNNTTGNDNIAIGEYAAINVSGSNSDNIHIGSPGSAADSGAIRIGTPGTQTSFFVAGVGGVTTANNDAVPVLIDSAGQLGTVSSSRRYKEDIQDMGDASSGLMHLRPVTFRYRKPFADGSAPIQYGLIAEEVAEVYPDLVAHSADGQIETVKYQVLDAMLLNEVQRQQRIIEQQRNEIEALKAQLNGMMESRLVALEKAVARNR
jgi:hypothetical protein